LKGKYFRLYGYCRFLTGANGGCIYNMKTNEMIHLDILNRDILISALTHNNIDACHEQFFCELAEKMIGTFYENPVYAETFHIGVEANTQRIIPNNTYVERAFIQITEDCNLNCVFCTAENPVLRRCGCARWGNKKKSINELEWKTILSDLVSLNCRELVFTGGNPLLDLSTLEGIINLGKSLGMTDFAVQGNIYGIKESEIELMEKYGIKFRAQIFSLDNKSMYAITNIGIDCRNSLNELIRLKKTGVNVECFVVVSKYNEDNVTEMIHELNSYGFTVYLDFIHNMPENNHYSKKFISDMYDRTLSFGLVTKESMSFFEKYNSNFFGQISINLSGDITPDPLINDLVLGNVLDEGLSAVLTDKAYKRLVEMNKSQIPKCANCSFRLNCPDNRAIEYSATGEIDGLIYCNVFRSI